MYGKDTPQVGKYELHVTLESPAELEGWKASSIAGDPLLGDGVKHYLTRYATCEEAAEQVLALAFFELSKRGYRVLRVKAELIALDVRFYHG